MKIYAAASSKLPAPVRKGQRAEDVHQFMWLCSDQVGAGLEAFGINRKLTATVTQNQEYLLPALTGST